MSRVLIWCFYCKISNVIQGIWSILSRDERESVERKKNKRITLGEERTIKSFFN